MDPNRYIKNIVRSKQLFQERKREERKTPTGLILLLVLLGLGLFWLSNAQLTGYATQRYVSFDAELEKGIVTFGEPVMLHIEPTDAQYSIAVILPDGSIEMIDSLAYIPTIPGLYTIDVLLYLGTINERFSIPFEVVEESSPRRIT
ncbi:hypothetical protein HYS48_00585 [Candidatus Woesearchaeota archaeon]|nr:hypothetical protein [Candidatus Woesearchaeota archaeon]